MEQILFLFTRNLMVGIFPGCRVIGFAGTDDKCEYLEKELGFDRAFNYKTADIKAALREGAPKRVDCYFDNVSTHVVFKLYLSDYILPNILAE